MLCRVVCAWLLVAWTAELRSGAGTQLYYDLWRSPLKVLGDLFQAVPGIRLMPWQLVVLVLAPVCLLQPAAFKRRERLMDAAILVSLASLVLTLGWGLVRGGSAYQAYYQVWRFLTALLVGTMLASTVRTSRDLKAIGLTILAAAFTRCLLGIYFYWAHVHGKVDPPPPHITTHDDSLLFVGALLIMVSWALARGRLRTWLAVGLLALPLLYVIVLNKRRLAWIELAFALAFAYLLLPRGKVRRRVNVAMLFVAPAFLVYVAVGWGRQERIFEPLRAFSTAGSYEDNSSLARQEEIKNLLYTLGMYGNPLFGTGWGHPYEKVTSVYANFGAEWEQYAYLPHNSLLALAVFGGLVGIFGIWLVVPVAAFLATRGYRGATGEVERAAGMAAVCILPAYSAQCYGDIGFQSLTCSLIFATAIAAAAKVLPLSQARAVRRDRLAAAAS